MTISQESGPGKKKCSICIALGLGRGGHWHAEHKANPVQNRQMGSNEEILIENCVSVVGFQTLPCDLVGEKGTGTQNMKVTRPVLNRQIGPKTDK